MLELKEQNVSAQIISTRVQYLMLLPVLNLVKVIHLKCAEAVGPVLGGEQVAVS